jgi:hypothetical protein
MSEGEANEFLSKVSEEKLWQYMELKACLLNDSRDRWKVAFLNLQLSNDSTVSNRILNVDNKLLLIHRRLRIGTLNRIIEQIIAGKQISLEINNTRIEASLEWIKGSRLRYGFKLRSYIQQEFNIDNACHLLIQSGEYNEQIDMTVQNLEPKLSMNNPPFRNLKDAVTSILNIGFGTPAFSPFVRIIAPIYVKIEETKTSVLRIEVSVGAAIKAELSKIRLTAFGENENARPTQLREKFAKLSRRESNELLKPIKIDVDKETRYVRLSLYYREDLLEDNFVTVPKLVKRWTYGDIEPEMLHPEPEPEREREPEIEPGEITIKPESGILKLKQQTRIL